MIEINRGGFGIIERVKLDNGNQVARKTFNPKNSDQLEPSVLEKLRKRFIIEVKTQELLSHEIFIPVLGSDLTGDNPWYIMPLASRVYSDEIEMARLEQRVPEGLSDILNSMEALHSLGYVHRDIKPQNILFHEGRWKLSDFGLISTNVSVLSQFSTSDGDRGGTEMYMAPEQYKNFKNATVQSDIYSFGAILHDIFDGSQRTPYSSLSSQGQIGFIIKKCTEENPRNRFTSVASLRSTLLTTIEKLNNQVDVDPDAKVWVKKLENYLDWDEEEFEKFCFGVDRLTDPKPIFIELKTQNFSHLKDVDEFHWDRLVTMYLDWIQESDFLYDYCDVLIGRILKIYELTSNINVQCKCVISASSLGAKHNRWYVMHRVIRMANVTISDNLAQRLSIEMEINDNVKFDFSRCISEISLRPENCHPIIAKLFVQ